MSPWNFHTIISLRRRFFRSKKIILDIQIFFFFLFSRYENFCNDKHDETKEKPIDGSLCVADVSTEAAVDRFVIML